MSDPEGGGPPELSGPRVLSREQLEAEVRKRTAELRNVMDTMADVLVTLDAEGRIETTNAAFEEVLGYDPDAVTGRPVAVLFASEDGATDRGVSGAAFVDRLLSDGSVTDVEVTFETVDGETVPMQLSASTRREEGTVTGYVCVATDVTEIRRRERQLERQNEYLDEFASVVSHDIATPLGVIRNKARLVEMTGDTGHAEDIHDATERIQELVDDLLELARQGKRVGETEPVDLATVAREAWRSVDGSGADLTAESSARIRASPERLRQLLENLFRNAVEHGSTSPRSSSTREDAVEHGSTSHTDADASVDAVEHGSTSPDSQARQDPGKARSSEPSVADAPSTPGGGGRDTTVGIRVGATDDGFFVADDGPGIPADERSDVFEQGYTTGEDGTGLGLAIVSRVADAHGWSVSVTDSADGGARFELSGVTVEGH